MTDPGIVFFDIDGTLSDNDTRCVPESAKNALNRLKAEGFKLCIASGRNFFRIHDEIRQINKWDYYISCNGHEIFDKKGNCLLRKFFPREVVEKCIELSGKTSVNIELKTEDSTFIIYEPDETMLNAFDYFNVTPPTVKKYEGEKITSMMLFPVDGRKIPEFDDYEAIETLYGEAFYCDIVLKGFDKISAIRRVMEISGESSFIAIGDSNNDIKMIKEAAIGIAMGNANEKVKEAADFVTTHIKDNGIANAVDFILRRKL